MKKQITFLCCVLCVVALFTGCSKKQTIIPAIDREQIENNIQVMVDQIVCDLPDEEGEAVQYYDDSYYCEEMALDRKEWAEKQELLGTQHELYFKNQKVYTAAVESYYKASPDSGKAFAIDYDTLNIGYGKEGGYEVTVDLKCETRDLEMALSYNTEMEITNAAFNVQYSIAENLQKAGMNTLLGMGTVFCILILISLIISLFGIIPKMEAAKKAKAKAQAPEAPAAPAAAPAVVEEEDLSDDLELVAVIAAAIAAYEGSEDASGYVVRSIRKSKKWLNA